MEDRYTLAPRNQINPEEEFSRLFGLAPKTVPGSYHAEDGVGTIELRPPSPAPQSVGVSHINSITSFAGGIKIFYMCIHYYYYYHHHLNFLPCGLFSTDFDAELAYEYCGIHYT